MASSCSPRPPGPGWLMVATHWVTELHERSELPRLAPRIAWSVRRTTIVGAEHGDAEVAGSKYSPAIMHVNGEGQVSP